jgi:hypothetical protein
MIGMKRYLALISCILISTSLLFTLDSSCGLEYSAGQSLDLADASFVGTDSSAGVGDVNGDGYDDIVICLDENDWREPPQAEIHLIFGGASGWGMRTDLSKANVTFFSEFPRTELSATGAGDVNGDNFDDILISEIGNIHSMNYTGETYIIFGKAFGWARNVSLSEADASVIGEDTWDHSGGSISSAGDINGDGYDDILIGASWNNEGGETAGKTYLIFGKASGWERDMPLSKADVSFIGEFNGHFSGAGVEGPGDINGDGFDDILISADSGGTNGRNQAGKTYIIFGKSSGWPRTMRLSKADASFIGENKGDFAIGIAAAGDVNGDGFKDILIGSSNSDGGHDAGKIYLIFGKAEGWRKNINLSLADAAFIGEHRGDSASVCAGPGDVNKDGYDDILIGAPENSESNFVSGKTYLILGKPSGWAMVTNLSKVNITFLGEGDYDHSGQVGWAGDLNGDGYNDILVQTSYTSYSYVSTGQTYIIFGGMPLEHHDHHTVKGDQVLPLEILMAVTIAFVVVLLVFHIRKERIVH